MKKSNLSIFIIGSIILTMTACEKNQDKISHTSANYSINMITNVQTLKTSDDDVSNHVDSILSGLIESDVISSGNKYFDLNGDQKSDIAFEIIDLQKLNNLDIPDTLDSLAAVVHIDGMQLLDNSTYGYVDALNLREVISVNGHWTSSITENKFDQNFIIGTLASGGQFEGKGERYLAFRIPATSGDGYQYGWMKLNCSQGNDHLEIIDFAINNTVGHSILAGQKE